MKKLDIDIGKITYLRSKGLSERKIAEIIKVSRSTIHSKLNDIHYNCGSRKRYSADENFFEVPNVINSYWAGFLAADGCISNNTIILEIHNKDEQHITKFCSSIKYNGAIYRRKNRDMVSVGIRSHKIISDLGYNFNIIPRKAKVLLPPNITNKGNIRSFIRGYIDGDGCYSDKYNLISVRGTKEMLLWMKNNLNELANLNTKTTVIYDYGSYKLQIRGKHKYFAAIKWIFENSNSSIVLDRKYDIVKPIVGEIEHINFIPVKQKIYKEIRKNIIKQRKNGMSKKEIADNNDVSKDFVSIVLKKNGISHLDRKIVSDEEIISILRELNNGAKFKDLAVKYDINSSTVYEISTGGTRKSKKLKEKMK